MELLASQKSSFSIFLVLEGLTTRTETSLMAYVKTTHFAKWHLAMDIRLKNTSSRLVFPKKRVLKNFKNFTGKTPVSGYIFK